MRRTINKKVLAPAFFILLAVAGMSSAELVGHWTFEEVSDGIVPDVAGGDDNGTLLGGTSIVTVGVPVGAGTMKAAQFSAAGDEIELVETGNLSPGTGPWSYAGWFKLDGTGGTRGNCLYGDRGGTSTWGPAAIVISINPAGELDLFFRDLASSSIGWVTSGLGIQKDVWNHLAVVRDGGTIKAYLNGQFATEKSGTLNDINMMGVSATVPVGNYPRLGTHPNEDYQNDLWEWQFGGLMADVRIYNHALSEAEVAESMQPAEGLSWAMARDPQPANNAVGVLHNVALSWTAGNYAPAVNGHRLYLSQSFEDVNDGLDAALIGIQSAPRYPQSGTVSLEFGSTYYWRVDEANSVSGWDQGNIWQFKVEPEAVPVAAEDIIVTASSTEQGKSPAGTVDGSGLDENDLHSTSVADMWLSEAEPNGAWIEYEFDKLYKLHEMWVWNYNGEGLNAMAGLKDVVVEYSSNGTDYVSLEGVNEFAAAPGTAGYEHNTVVDFAGLTARYVRILALSNWSGGFVNQYGLSEVRFNYIPMRARDPVPAPEATDVDPDAVVLGWTPGRQAASHNVYLGTSEDVVDFVTGTSDSHLDVGILDLGQTYYWLVDEVNEAEDPDVWQGELWSFTVSDFIVVDDFESYTDDDAAGKAIWQSWPDGYQIDDNGSQVGNLMPPYAEQTIVHSGRQSMSLSYTNTAGVIKSEATRTFDEPQDWTRANIGELSLWLRGHLGPAGNVIKSPSGSYTVSAAGAGIGGQDDEFYLAYQQTTAAENTVIAKIDSIDNKSQGARAGIMFRETLDADSRFAMVAVSPSSGIIFQWRTDTGGGTGSSTIADLTAPYWLKLERSSLGNCKAYYSPDGTEGSWVQLGANQLIYMDAPVAGLAMTSSDIATVSEATFSNVSINGSAPANLISQDIASVSNDAQPVYVVLEDAAGNEVIGNHEDPAATLTPLWQEWRINLSQLTDDQFDLTRVQKMTLGVGSRNAENAQAGGTGTMYFDDIRLYPAPFQALSALVGHWTFDDVTDSNVPDAAGGDDNGTLLGGTSIVASDAPVPGGTTYAAKFSAVGDQIELVETGNLSPGTGPWSYAGWFLLDGNGGAKGNCVYSERGGTGTWGPAAIVININPAGELDLFFRDIGNKSIAGVTSGLGIQNNIWYHLAVVRDGGTVTAYLDGRQVWQKSGTLEDMNMAGVSASTPLGNYPRFGDHPNNDGNWQFSGLMDDIRIYKAALTADDVQTLYNGGLPQPVGHWTFDDVTDSNVPDSAGGDDNGTLLGGTSIVASDAPVPGGTTYAAKFSAVGDQIELVETGNLSPGTGPWSYAGWFLLDGNGGAKGNCVYSERGGTGTYGPAAIVININPAGELDLFFRDIGNKSIAGVTSGLGIQNNLWYHLAVVRDGGTVTAYLDGQLIWEKSGTLDDMNMAGVSADTPLGNYPRFGDHPNLDGGWQFSGLMDDVRVYKAALTADDVRTLYDGGL